MYKVKAVFEYTSEHDDDLNFPLGQIITVTEEEDAEWLVGEYTDDAGQHQEGMFPRNFVEKYEPVAPPRPTRARKRDSELPAGASSIASATAVAPPSPADERAPSPPPPAPVAIPAPVPMSPTGTHQSIEEAEENEREPEKDEPAQEVEPKATPQLQPVKVASPPASPPAPVVTAAAPAPPFPKPVESAYPVSPIAAPGATDAARSSPSASSKPSPPPVSEKPSSFRDRIAAFNKAAAPPITPFKPSGLAAGGGSSNFIKKPFVAPPPSRHAFIPSARDVPTARVYRRDEDPEIKERLAENQESAEKAGLAAGPSTSGNNNDDEEPKPMMSLKERMARLQREQQEQAQRHAEAAAKKEKPKRPPKKRIESYESSSAAGSTATTEDPAGAAQLPPLERKSTGDTVGRQSIDESVSGHQARAPHPPRRKASKDTTGVDAQDGNDADMSGAGDTTEGQEDDLTERDDSDEKSRRPSRTVPIIVPVVERRSVDQSRDVVEEEDEEPEAVEEKAPHKAKDVDAEEEQEDGAGGEDEETAEEVDPEARRREELRARMAKMSGGMGMMGMQGMQGMFGAPPPMPPKKKMAAEPRASESTEDATPVQRAPPVPTMMALPGMVPRRSAEKAPEPAAEDEEEEDEEEEPTPAAKEAQSPTLSSRGTLPPVPSGRPVPPPPPPPAADVKSPSEGSASDDELSEGQIRDPLDTPRGEPAQFAPPPPPPPPSAPRPPPPVPVPTSPRVASSGLFGGDEASPASPTSTLNKRASRLPPPIPGLPPAPPPAQTRAPPPPPPPPGTLSRQSTADSRMPLSPVRPASPDEEEEEEVTEYEGDYDTDIANPVTHKNSLKAHARDSSLEDSVSLRSPISEKTPSFPPSTPIAARAPPPIPHQPPPAPNLPASHHSPRPPPAADKRRSVDMPRAPPPPPPPSMPAPQSARPRTKDDFDPFNYASQPSFMNDAYTPPDLSLSMASAAGRGTGGNQHPQAPPPPPPPPPQAPAPAIGGRSARQSMDLSVRGAAAGGRRSIDMARPSMETGYVANELDLAPSSGWWLQPNGLPPQLQGRKDIFYESEQTQAARGQKVIINRDLYILYQDYSQTVINVQFDPSNSADVELEQRHEAPPRPLREHQFEEAYTRFGSNISNAVLAKKETVVGDGTPQGLILELLKQFPDALPPIGTRAYGALVYANMANASTTLTDLIRPGDIITLRNAKFQGKHGAMHAKYSMEVGKPDHVGVVSEWDGTKKKVRAWEQGRESKKVKLESFKLDDLRSGEVRIWRVMPRKWIGWEDSSGQK